MFVFLQAYMYYIYYIFICTFELLDWFALPRQMLLNVHFEHKDSDAIYIYIYNILHNENI